MQLDRVMSIMRYWPPKGTAGFARSRVRGKSLSPAPPASSTPSVSLISKLPCLRFQLLLEPQNPKGVAERWRIPHGDELHTTCVGPAGACAAPAVRPTGACAP